MGKHLSLYALLMLIQLLYIQLSYVVCEDGLASKFKPVDVCDGNLCHEANDGTNKNSETNYFESESKSFGPAVHPCVDDRWDNDVTVFITFTNAAHNIKLQNKFRLTVSSMLQHTTIQLSIYIIGDDESHLLAKRIIDDSSPKEKRHLYKVKSLDVDQMARQLDDIVRPMQRHFSYKPGAYYNHALFFLSIAVHRIFPSLCRVIMLDADLKIVDDIRHLADRFRLFSADNLIGIARDMQPVYRHALWQYRRDNPGTRVGEPPPDGLTGFNSGVLLLDLHRMRASRLYNSLVTAEAVAELTAEFHFKGHLGDQDFFTLLSFRYERLFHVLPCGWNRQLCTWWGKHGYADILHLYHSCDGPVHIYHGNCDTPIP